MFINCIYPHGRLLSAVLPPSHSLGLSNYVSTLGEAGPACSPMAPRLKDKSSISSRKRRMRLDRRLKNIVLFNIVHMIHFQIQGKKNSFFMTTASTPYMQNERSKKNTVVTYLTANATQTAKIKYRKKTHLNRSHFFTLQTKKRQKITTN